MRRHATAKSLVGDQSTKIRCFPKRLRMPSVTYSSVLQVRPSTVMLLARLLLQRRESIGTRTGRRALPPRSHAVLVLRWFLDGTRITQLAADSAIGVSTCYRYLHEAIAVLACRTPDIHEALTAAAAKRRGAELVEAETFGCCFSNPATRHRRSE
jgi:hypothetical protein